MSYKLWLYKQDSMYYVLDIPCSTIYGAGKTTTEALIDAYDSYGIHPSNVAVREASL